MGGISRESAWKIAYYRGALAARLTEPGERRGSMLSVALSLTEVQKYLPEISARFGNGRLSIGCVNSPCNLTITGDEECIDALNILMEQHHIYARKLRVTVAYHSSHMEHIASEYRRLIKDIVPGPSSIHGIAKPTLFSSVSGHQLVVEELHKVDYWVTNMVSQVKFSEALSHMCISLSSHVSNPTEKPSITLIEIGPHALLGRPVKETLRANPGISDIRYDKILVYNVSAVKSTLELMGRLHCSGCIVDRLAINSPNVAESELELLPNLPEYPFNHSHSYWHESRLSRNFRFRQHPRHELLGVTTEDWNPLEAKWRNILRVSENPWIRDHKESQPFPFRSRYSLLISH